MILSLCKIMLKIFNFSSERGFQGQNEDLPHPPIILSLWHIKKCERSVCFDLTYQQTTGRIGEGSKEKKLPS